MISQSAENVEVYYQLEVLNEQIAKTLTERPDDAVALAALAEVKLDNGQLDDAISLLRQSYQKLPEDDTRINQEEPNALEPDEVVSFLVAAREKTPQHYPMILVLLVTGARMSAVCALKWDDVDFDNGLLRVDEKRFRLSTKEREIVGEGVYTSLPKTEAGIRQVPLIPEAAEKLRA